MKSTNETGHAKNVANFGELIATVSAMGPGYNPTRKNLGLTELNSRLNDARNALAAVNNALPVYSSAVAARAEAFAPLSILSTRILNALKASGTGDGAIENAQSVIRKLQGRRATPKLSEEEKKAMETNGKAVKEISASQMGFDNRINHFEVLLQLLSSIPEYGPNEEDLKLTSLSALLGTLKQKNQAVLDAEILLENARLARNSFLYGDGNGVVELASDIKTYVKSAFGTGSVQYRQISGIALRNIA